MISEVPIFEMADTNWCVLRQCGIMGSTVAGWAAPLTNGRF